jgi:hypothetical protein
VTILLIWSPQIQKSGLSRGVPVYRILGKPYLGIDKRIGSET